MTKWQKQDFDQRGRREGRAACARATRSKTSAHGQAFTARTRQPLWGSGTEAVVLHFENRASIAAALDGIDKLFLVTPGSPDRGRFEEDLLAEAKKAGVKHIVKDAALGESLFRRAIPLRP